MEPERDLVATPAASSFGDGGALCHAPINSPLARGDTASMMGAAKCNCGALDDEVAKPSSHPSSSPEESAQPCASTLTLGNPAVGTSIQGPTPGTNDQSNPTEGSECEFQLVKYDLDVSPRKPPPFRLPPTDSLQVPAWLQGLLDAELFVPCSRHTREKRNETNYFCPECSPGTGHGMCKHCHPDHAALCTSPLFQIRRYMYQCVVHVDELSTRYNLAGVQSYCINSRRAVLIRPKPAPPTAETQPAFSNRCQGCAIPLRPDCTFCSLKCKVDVEYKIQPATPGLHLFNAAAAAAAAYTSTGQKRCRPFSATDTDNGQESLIRMLSCGNVVSSGVFGSKRRKTLYPQRSHLT